MLGDVGVARFEEAGQVADDPTPKSDHCRIAAVPLGQHLVGQTSPRFAGLVGLAGRDDQGLQRTRLELTFDPFSVQRLDIRVGYERVSVRRRDFAGE